MIKIITALCLLMSFCSAAMSQEGEQHKTNIGLCSELLPSDHKYKLVLTTTIDTSQEARDLNWSIKMDDGQGEEKSDTADDEKDKRIEPFIECLINVVQ